MELYFSFLFFLSLLFNKTQQNHKYIIIISWNSIFLFFFFFFFFSTKHNKNTTKTQQKQNKTQQNTKDGTNDRLWMAQDSNDRTEWIAAIRTASKLESVTLTLKDDSTHCDHVREQIQQSETKVQYLSTMASLLDRSHSGSGGGDGGDGGGGGGKGRVRVPIAWLRKEKQNMVRRFFL